MTFPQHSTAVELDLADDWVTPDDIADEVQRLNDPAYHASLWRQFGPAFEKAWLRAELNKLKSQVARLARPVRTHRVSLKQLVKNTLAAGLRIARVGTDEKGRPFLIVGQDKHKPDAADINPFDVLAEQLRKQKKEQQE